MYNDAIFILPNTNILDLSGNYAVTNIRDDPQTRVEHCDKKYTNCPVNIRLVKTFYTDQFSISAINITVYIIKFVFSSRDEVTWYFKNSELRIREIHKILNLTVGKNDGIH